MKLFNEIENTLTQLSVDGITDERKLSLNSLVNYIKEKQRKELQIRLNFICTHNSRRSHLSQIWAQTIASYLNIPNVFCYSGGTEATALFPTVAETLKNSGFKIELLSKEVNPVYSIKYANNEHPIIGFSKKYGASFNPSSNFAAILTCSSADVGCPFIAGADQRIPLTFEDPKAFDNTAQQADKYKERSLQIATELLYVFNEVKNN